MRRHTLILLMATLLALAVSLVMPATSQAQQFVGTTQAQREAYTKRQYTIDRIVTCLREHGQPATISVPRNNTIRHSAAVGGGGHPSCDTLTRLDQTFSDNSLHNDLKMPADQIIDRDAMSFLSKMGYSLNSDGTELVSNESVTNEGWVKKFLDVYNDGNPADLTNPDVRYTTVQKTVSSSCNLKDPIRVSEIESNSSNSLKLNSARNEQPYDGKNYVIVNSIGSSDAIETLYHIDVGGGRLSDCRENIASLNTAASSVVNRNNTLNQAKKDEALADTLYDSLCPASSFITLVDPSVSTTNTAVNVEAQNACKQKVTNCTVAEGPGIPRTNSERIDCLKVQFPERDIDTMYSQALASTENAGLIIENETATAGEGAVECGSIVDGIGWAVCPALNAMGGLNDWMWKLASDLLQVNPLRSEGQESEEAVYTIWSALRDIANALLIVAFMVVVYGQITGGVSNYNIKKMLPKIIIVAIAINISFFIVALLVDIFNILGQSIYGLMTGILESSSTRVVPSWESLIGIIVAAGATTGGVAIAVMAAGGAKAALLMALPAALITFLGFLAALLTLMVRQALIPILAVLAPVAFVAYILPNTERWFKRWWSLLVSMLALYPMAALLFGGVQISAWIIAGDNSNWLNTLIALIMMGAPLFMLPFIARQSGPMLSKLNGAMSGMAGKLGNPLSKYSKNRADLASAAYRNKPIRTNKKGKVIARDRLRSVRHGFDRRRKDRELRTSLYDAATDQQYREGLVGDPSRLGGLQNTVGGQAYMDKLDREAAQNIFNFEYKSKPAEALGSDNTIVQALAAENLSGKGEFGAKQMYKYLESGGQITSVEMADSLTRMKGVHAGLGEVGAAALKHFQTGATSPFSTSSQELVTSTEVGLTKLGGEARAKQGLDAVIQGSSAIKREEAAKMIKDPRLSNTMTADVLQAYTNIANGLPAAQGTSAESNQISATQQSISQPNPQPRRSSGQVANDSAAPRRAAGGSIAAPQPAAPTTEVDESVLVIDRSGDNGTVSNPPSQPPAQQPQAPSNPNQTPTPPTTQTQTPPETNAPEPTNPAPGFTVDNQGWQQPNTMTDDQAEQMRDRFNR